MIILELRDWPRSEFHCNICKNNCSVNKQRLDIPNKSEVLYAGSILNIHNINKYNVLSKTITCMLKNKSKRTIF